MEENSACFLPGAHGAVSSLKHLVSLGACCPRPFLNPKHRQCYKEDGSSKSPDCPVCSRSLNKLAQPLPMAHCANSRLVCKISGDVMNENNPPMMLPNGYVYGYNVRAGKPGGGSMGFLYQVYLSSGSNFAKQGDLFPDGSPCGRS